MTEDLARFRDVEYGELVQEGFTEPGPGEMVQFEYGLWETAESTAIECHANVDTWSWRLSAVCHAVFDREGESGLNKIAGSLNEEGATLLRNYVRPRLPLTNLNPRARAQLLSFENLSLYHFRMAAPLYELSPESYVTLLETAGNEEKSARWVQRQVKLIKKSLKYVDPGEIETASDSYRVIKGDLTSAIAALGPESVDCIITDPPYEREAIESYAKLSSVASVVLKQGGSLIVMCGQSHLPEFLEALKTEMGYQWTVAYLTPGGQAPQISGRRVNTFWKPVVWLVKETYDGDWIGDVANSPTNNNDKRFHEWGQSEAGMADLIERFTYPDQTILDPFCGGGTTGYAALSLGRKFVGIDRESSAVNQTKKRLKELEAS